MRVSSLEQAEEHQLGTQLLQDPLLQRKSLLEYQQRVPEFPTKLTRALEALQDHKSAAFEHL